MFDAKFGAGGLRLLAEAPGRVNLIGDHTDYNGLPVFPMALDRRVRILLGPRSDTLVRLASGNGYADREFEIAGEIEPWVDGDWGNYVKASARILARRYGALRGMDAVVESDLPAAAGLSSSSALVVASALALLAANGIDASREDLLELLPEGERYVGTRGGAMDHAVSLWGEKGAALKIDFTPFHIEPVPAPADWTFLIAHSLVRAAKSSGAKAEYNSRRESCARALERLAPGSSYTELLRAYSEEHLLATAKHRLSDEDFRRFRHVITEASRVERAHQAMPAGDLRAFGSLMTASHASLRDDFEVSHPNIDALVEALLTAGAAGARVTGAGFGGCVVALCRANDAGMVRERVEQSFYAGRPERTQFPEYLLEAVPSSGARVTGAVS